MKRPLLLLLCALCAATAPAGSEPETAEPRVFERNAMATPDAYVFIKAVSGLVEVSGWNQISVYAEGTLGDALEYPVVTRAEAGQEIAVIVETENRNLTPDPTTDVQMQVFVPVHATVVVETVTAEVRVSGVRGTVETRSTRGDVSVEGPVDRVHVETFWGDIMVIGPVADSDLATWEGDIVADDVHGSAFLRAWNGDMRCNGTNLEQLDVFVASGSAHLGVSLTDAGTVQAVVNGTGDVQIDLPTSATGLFTFVGGPDSSMPDLREFAPSGAVTWTIGSPSTDEGGGAKAAADLQRRSLRDFSIPKTYGISTAREFSVGDGNARIIVQCNEIPEQYRERENRKRVVLTTTQ